VEAPINVSGNSQMKSGPLTVGALTSLTLLHAWGGVDNHGAKIVGLGDPTDDMDAVNKRYVDGLGGGGGGTQTDIYQCPIHPPGGNCPDGTVITSANWADSTCGGQVSFTPYCTIWWWAGSSVASCDFSCPIKGKVMIQ